MKPLVEGLFLYKRPNMLKDACTYHAIYMITNQFYLIVLPSYESRDLKIFTIDHR